MCSLHTAPLSIGPSDARASITTTSFAGVVAFLMVATEGSFAKAADRLEINRSAVSRNVQKLEAQLQVRLFRRTTRSVSLTREGELFYASCHPGMENLVQALEGMRELREGPPSGHLRIRSSIGFGRKVVGPLLRCFHEEYPGISLELLLDDSPADFASDRVDVAFRDGRMEDSQIVAKQLIPMQTVVCASPEYAHDHGLPRTVEELANHPCINLRSASGRVCEWEFKVNGQLQKLLPPSMLTFNDPELVMQAVLNGDGIAQLAAYQVCDMLRAGRLVTCLRQYVPDDRGHYVCYLCREHLPSRIRVFVDYMTAQTRALDLECPASFSIPSGTSFVQATDWQGVSQQSGPGPRSPWLHSSQGRIPGDVRSSL
jgi:LysR family transcriptional regulator for bpeEF and oprC